MEMARAPGRQLSVCARRHLRVAGAAEARGIDAERLGDVAGRPLRIARRGMRTACGCFASRDIGEYDTCPRGCVYCYAVQNHRLAQRRFREHDPLSEFLFSPSADIRDGPVEDRSGPSLPLFDKRS